MCVKEGMLTNDGIDTLFDDCARDLKRALILTEDCVSKTQHSTRSSIAEENVQQDDTASNEIAAALLQWKRELTIQDVLRRVLDVVVRMHQQSTSATASPTDAPQKVLKRWSAVMQQLLTSLAATSSTLTASTTRPQAMTSDVEQFLIAVLKYVWSTVMLHVSSVLVTAEERQKLPILPWLVETSRLGSLLIQGRRTAAVGNQFPDGSAGMIILHVLLDLSHTPELKLKENSSLVLGGYASLVRAVVLHAPADVRQRVLIREPIVDTFASKVRALFLDGTTAGATSSANAVANIKFITSSCGGPECGTFQREMWSAILGAMEGSCVGKGVSVQASRRGLASFVHSTVYLPIFGDTSVRDDNEATMLTAEYRLLRLIGDLGESELHFTNNEDEGPERHPASRHQELNRLKYKALLDNNNGVLTMDLVSQLVRDRGVMIEATPARSDGGLVVFRMFLPDASSSLAPASRGAGRLMKFQGKQQWVFVERGILHVKRQGGTTYTMVASVDELLQPFQQ
ncbi:Hypothetical protein, putative [Bodo saltans]|uniref:Uncharacterized protein n=1 Tax=Bodo saltans TaxID=75058 RepID=A0A0S4JHH7_BODSA|nr:Hypothetical protein, putative [Bodo saltans]|eukprot:CUG87854.1 Hypothetical protein, putative [Bodo saltans]